MSCSLLDKADVMWGHMALLDNVDPGCLRKGNLDRSWVMSQNLLWEAAISGTI